MRKRINNDFDALVEVLHEGVKIDLSLYEITGVRLVSYQAYHVTAYEVRNGSLFLHVTPLIVPKIGRYKIVVTYRMSDPTLADGFWNFEFDKYLVTIVGSSEEEDAGDVVITADAVIGMQGKKGDPFTYDDFTPAQLEALKVKGDPFLYEDFTPAQIAELQRPATDAIAAVNEAEALRVTAENIRVQNEQGRDTAEGLRVSAEVDRQDNEIARGSSEDDRYEAEALRLSAETTRDQNEQARVTAEGLRVTAESTRQTNTATAITNANNAATNANTKAWLADTAANNANAKATLANDAATLANTKAALAQTAATNADNARLAIQTDLEKKINTEDFYKIVNIGTGGLVSLKPTTTNFKSKLTVMANMIINIDLQKMLDAVGSARCRFIVDIPVAKTITWMKPILWGGTVPTMTAGQYVFEIIDLDGTNTPLIWLVSSTTKVSYTGVKLYVDSTGADYSTAQINGETATRTTSTWANPYRYLQNAINAASAGDVIFVKAGTYYPTHKRGTTVYTEGDKEIRSATFTMKNGVDVYGGFAGTETYAWQRVAGNVTILNGDLKRNATVADYAYNVVFANVASYTYLNGVTVVNGNANAVSGDALYVSGVTNYGGGINGQNANLVNISVTASGCTANNAGGGYYISTNYNCTASGCTANYGGGYYGGTNYNCTASGCTGMYGAGFSGTIYNCISVGNKITSTAGSRGCFNDQGKNYNSIFINNEAPANIMTYGFSFNNTENIGNTFINNKANGNLIEYSGAVQTTKNINNVFIGNVNTNGDKATFASNYPNNTMTHRNNAIDLPAYPTVIGAAGSDIDTSTCLSGITAILAGITVPSFVGVPTNQTQWDELNAYVANLRTHLKPLATSILKGKGVNNATYPNATDFEGTTRPAASTIGAFEAY